MQRQCLTGYRSKNRVLVCFCFIFPLVSNIGNKGKQEMEKSDKDGWGPGATCVSDNHKVTYVSDNHTTGFTAQFLKNK